MHADARMNRTQQTLVITGGQFDRPRFGSWMYDRGRGVWSRGPDQAADEDAHGTGRIHGGGASPNRHSSKWTRDLLAKLGVAYEPLHAPCSNLHANYSSSYPHAVSGLSCSFCS